MENFALELLRDHYDAVCEQLCELWDDEENTWDVIHPLELKRDSLREAIMKLMGS